MPAGTGPRPPWVSTHPVASSVGRGQGVQPSGDSRLVSARPVSGQLVASSGVRPSSCGVSARPSGRVRLVPASGGDVGDQVGAAGQPLRLQRGELHLHMVCSVPGRLGRGRGGLDAGATAGVVHRSAGRRPRAGRMVLRLGQRPRSAPTGQGGQSTVRGARRWRLRKDRERAAARRSCTYRVAVMLGLATRLRCVVAPGARSGRPDRPPSVPAGMGCGPSAAQPGSGCSRLGTDSAVSCVNGGGRDRV
jgi:hypothetical protein